MGMTISEKILAAHCGKECVQPGELIYCDVDIALGNDVTSPLAIQEFRALGAQTVFDQNKVVFVLDHFTPNKDIKSAEQCKIVRDFSRQQHLRHFYDVGIMGVEHALLPEKGIVSPGDVVIGADSHTCTYGALGLFSTGVGSTDLAAVMATGKVWFRVPHTMKFVYSGSLQKWVYGKDLILYTIGKIGVDGARYKAMEFTGPALQTLSQYSRFTMSNMAIEAGGKNGIFIPDAVTRAYVDNRVERPARWYTSDADAVYNDILDIDCSVIQPQVAFPHLPSNSRNINDIPEVMIDQVVIGSCTNGWLEDMRIAASVLKGKKVAKTVRLIVIPATPLIYRAMMQEGLVDIVLDAGGIVSTPTCGPCLGGHMGILAKGERALATTNRNFIGRMGDPQSEVYLANPAVAAATAIVGKIASPAIV